MDDAAIESILADNPLLQRNREKLEAFRSGAYCYHKTFGYGRVASYDDGTRRVVVDFKSKPGHAIDVVFAMKHLETLPSEHIIVRYHRDPSQTEKLLNGDHGAAVEIILGHCRENRATQMEIMGILSGIMEEKGLKQWWTKAKKALEANSKISIPETKSGYYVLRNQPIAQVDELIDGVLMAKQATKKLAYASRLLEETNLEDDREKILPVFEELQRIIQLSSTTATEKLLAWWVMNDLLQLVPSVSFEVEISLDGILSDEQTIVEVANGLPIVRLNRLFRCTREMFGERFPTVVHHLLRSGSLRTIGGIVNFLSSEGVVDVDLQKLFQQWIKDNSIRANLLEWILKNRKNAKYTAILSDSIGASHFHTALSLIDQESMRHSGNRKISLAEVIANDREVAEEIALNGSTESVKDLAQRVLSSQGFDILTKRSIVARFLHAHPSLQRLLDGGTEGDGSSSSAKGGGVLYVSQESLENVRREYELLVNKKIPENKRAIEIAREEGDLRENSEYKMARQDRDTLIARKEQIERDLERIQIINFADASTDKVTIGSVASLKNARGKSQKFAILGAWDSNPTRSIIAYQTPIGLALLGKKVGDTIQLQGRPEQRIVAIERWVDCADNW
ncbi:MAG: GreA/GreB family elongation factor [Puniceicoccales bacterium]|jgi:transcription elongation GreA/GreB family factor|nr:GreA/GreB family elongation factor [Puniceicoccales bacterium]